MKNKIFLLIFILSFLFPIFVFSGEPHCTTRNYTEFAATKEGCGDTEIKQKECTEVCCDGSCNKSCGPEETISICNPWQKPKRESGASVTAWSEEDINCVPDPECFPALFVDEFRDGRGKVDPSKIHLPVKFVSYISTPGYTGWGLSCGPNQISIKILPAGISRTVGIEKFFSEYHERNTPSDRERLDQLWSSGNLGELAGFLKNFTNDDSLDDSQGTMDIKENDYQKGNVLASSSQETTSYEKYAKLKRALQYPELRKQIEYFIFLKESIEISEYFKNNPDPITGETIDQAYCGYYGGRNPRIGIGNSEPLQTVKITYSPSQDREVGPCKIPINATNTVLLAYCRDGNCSPNFGATSFHTVDAPEPIGILAFKKDDIEEIRDERNEKEIKTSFSTKVSRWVDPDWNGPEAVKIPPELGGDFVDFQFCGQEKIKTLNSPFDFRALYVGKKMIFDSTAGCPKDPELEEIEEALPKTCVSTKEKCICDEKPQWCKIDCGFIKWDEGWDICHPIQRPESLRIDFNEPYLQGKNKEDDLPSSTSCPPYYPFAAEWNVNLASKEEIKLDWIDDPYYKVSSVDLPFPEKLWKWDLRLQYFPASPIINVWQVKYKNSQHWSQKWHFVLGTDVPLKAEEEKIGEKIYKTIFKKIDSDYFRSTIRFDPLYHPLEDGDRNLVFNRLQKLVFSFLPRTLSYKIEIKNKNGNSLKFLPIFVHLRYRKLILNQIKSFNLWEIWPCLKDPPDAQPSNEVRLNKEFSISISPSKDEWGNETLFKVTIYTKTTGAPPKNLAPPPPDPAKVPRDFTFDPVPGAASYLIEINGEKYQSINVPGKEEKPAKYFANLKTEGDYKWKVRSCADQCSTTTEEYLHCGTPSEEVKFHGCPLPPPPPISPSLGETFLKGSNVSLNWERVTCNDAKIYYQLIVSYTPSQDEKNCKAEKIVDGEILEENGYLLSNLNCLGSYFWQVRTCLDKECKEAGNWLTGQFFNISLNLPPKGGGEFGGVGTCKKIAPDCPPEGCGLSEIPKLIFNILNCLLWTGIPILIIIGIGTTGFTLIFLSGNVKLVERIKEIWRGIGIGTLIMLFGWTILNLIFTILGWKESFGKWWNPM